MLPVAKSIHPNLMQNMVKMDDYLTPFVDEINVDAWNSIWYY
jgi:hypothetical protein